MYGLRSFSVLGFLTTPSPRGGLSQWRRVLILAMASLLAAPGWAQPGSQTPHQEEATDLVLLLDRSGSMKKNDQRGLSRALALYLLDQTELAGGGNRVAVVPFETDVAPMGAGMTTDLTVLREGLKRLAAPAGQTDIEMALRTAARLLAPLDDGRRKQVVMLTDGMPEPDPRDADRFPEIAEQFKRQTTSLSVSSREFRRILEELSLKAVGQTIQNIENVVLPAMEGKVEVFPIGLHSTDTGREFLEKIAVRTTRMAESFTLVSNSNELVLAAHRLVHRGSQTIPVVQDRQEAPETEYRREIDFGPYFSKARVVVNYLEEGIGPEDLDISLVSPEGETLGRDSDSYLSARDRDGEGGLVFERFMLDQLGQGRWRIELKSRRATKRLPAFELLVEGRSNLRLLVEANPTQVQVPGPVEIRAALSSADGHPVAIAGATGELRDREGGKTALAFVTESGGVAVGRIDLPEQPLGDYLVTVRATVTDAASFAVSGRGSFLAVPQEAVELAVAIPYGGGDPEGGDSLSFDKLTFPPVGDQQLSATIRGIEVDNTSARSAAVSVELVTLTHNASGEFLDPGSWFTASPRRGSSLKDRPYRFDLALKVPKRLPASLSNGLYTGLLRIHSPDALAPLEVPLEVTLTVPDIVIADPGVAQVGLGLSLWWRRPGEAKESLRLRSNSAATQKAAVRLISHVTDGQGGVVDAGRLHLVGGEGFTEQVDIAPDSVVTIPLKAVAKIAGVEPGSYRGEVFIDAERARDLRVPVNIEVPSLQWIDVARLVAIVSIALSLLWAAWLLHLRARRRGLFQGDSWELQTQRDFQNGIYLFAPDGRSLFTIRRGDARAVDEPSYQLSAAGGSPLEVTDGFNRLDEPYTLSEDLEVRSGGFRFRMQRLSANVVRARVLQSPYSRSNWALFTLLIVAFLLALLFAWWTLA